MRVFIALFISTLVATAQAQTPKYELDGRNIVLPSVCNGSGGASQSMALPSDIPLPATVVGVGLANNGVWPASAAGIWFVGFDRGGVWTAASGYPANQFGPFYGINPLVELPVQPGASNTAYQALPAPLIVRHGDLFVIGVPCTGNFPTQPMWTVHLAYPYGEVPLVSVVPPANPVLIYGPNTVTGDNGSSVGLSVRNITQPLYGMQSGANFSMVSVTLKGGAVTGLNPSHVSVGVSSASGANTLSTPTEALFGGASGFSGSPGGLNTSDWTPLNIGPGQQIVVDIDGSSTASSSLSVQSASPGTSYWKASSSGYNQAIVSGYNPGGNTNFSLYSVQAR